MWSSRSKTLVGMHHAANWSAMHIAALLVPCQGVEMVIPSSTLAGHSLSMLQLEMQKALSCGCNSISPSLTAAA